MDTEPDFSEAALSATSSVLAALVGAGVGGTEGAVAAGVVAPATLELARGTMTEFAARFTLSIGRVIQGASERTGDTPEDLVAKAKADPRKVALLAEAMVAAGRTLNEQKIRGLASALANGLLGDEAAVDDSQIIIRALAELEEPHIRLLGLLVQDFGQPRLSADIWAMRKLAKAETATEAIVATLLRTAILKVDESHERDAQAKQIQQAFKASADNALHAQRSSSTVGYQVDARLPSIEPVRGYTRWLLTGFGIECWEHLSSVDPGP